MQEELIESLPNSVRGTRIQLCVDPFHTSQSQTQQLKDFDENYNLVFLLSSFLFSSSVFSLFLSLYLDIYFLVVPADDSLLWLRKSKGNRLEGGGNQSFTYDVPSISLLINQINPYLQARKSIFSTTPQPLARPTFGE
ncbi:hypothetical protein Dimus_005477 [Dionaea muscipula]